MTILRIDSSINGENSASRHLTDSIVEQLKPSNWGEQVVTRDLVADPLPHLTLEAFADSTVLDEFLAADVVVIGAPMYNFTAPSQRKARIDPLAIAGKTFHYTANGPEGLVKDKRVIVALARGNFYGEGAPAAPLEHLETYLKGVVNFIGVEAEFVRAEGLGLSPEHRDASLKDALVFVERLAT